MSSPTVLGNYEPDNNDAEDDETMPMVDVDEESRNRIARKKSEEHASDSGGQDFLLRTRRATTGLVVCSVGSLLILWAFNLSFGSGGATQEHVRSSLRPSGGGDKFRQIVSTRSTETHQPGNRGRTVVKAMPSALRWWQNLRPPSGQVPPENLASPECLAAFSPSGPPSMVDANPDVVTAEDFYFDRLLLENLHKREFCPPSNRIPANIIEGHPHLKFDLIVLEAVPKAGSTSLRQTVPILAPTYKNLQGKPKGEENDWEPCVQRGNVTREARFVFVGDPFNRFFKGLHEVTERHRERWERWRRQHNRVDPSCNLCNLSEIESEYLQDMSDGFVDYHTRSQTSILFGDPSSRWPDFVGRIEWDTSWPGMRSKIGLPILTPPVNFPRTNMHKINESVLTPASWRLFCKFYRQDYACLRYMPPSECIDIWSRLL